MSGLAIWIWITIVSIAIVILCRIFLWSLWLQIPASILLVFACFQVGKTWQKKEESRSRCGWLDSD